MASQLADHCHWSCRVICGCSDPPPRFFSAQGPLPSLSRPYTADMDPCATAHRRNHVVGCWGSYSTFRESAPSISTARCGETPTIVVPRA